MKRPDGILVITVICLVLLFIAIGFQKYTRNIVPPPDSLSSLTKQAQEAFPLFTYIIEKDIDVEHYFSWIHSITHKFDSLVPYDLSPSILVHANPWIIDTFASSDYYHQMARGIFVYDQKKWPILTKGDTILIPSTARAADLQTYLNELCIDINLPEYTLRILYRDSTLYHFPVRIGQNTEKYLATEGRIVNLRTVIGSGKISNVILDPKYINFSTGKEYLQTRRDDGKITLMPLIPTLEPEINGICYGQMIHPTTNPETLGKAYSHGCIGTKEGDAWRIYFHAQLGTPIRIRYDLEIIDEKGDSIMLEDIYKLY